MFENSVIERPVTMGSAALRERYATAYNGEPSYLQYRSFAEFSRLTEESASWAIAYLNEAYLLNDEYDAYVEQAARNARQAAPAPVADITLSTYERDQEAALAQAEVLGATADQRRKLRAIVEAEHDARAEVTRLNAEVARLSGDIEDPNDRRVWGIFGKAAKEANDQGYCSVYDQISRAVNIPDRDELREAGYLGSRKWDVGVAVSVSYTEYVTVTVEADNQDEAIEEADNMTLRDIYEYMDANGHYLERSDLDSHNVEEAEEVDE